MKRFFVTTLILVGLLVPIGTPVLAQGDDAPTTPEVVVAPAQSDIPTTGNVWLDWGIWILANIGLWVLAVVPNLDKVKRFAEPGLAMIGLGKGSEFRAFALSVLVVVACYLTTLTDINLFLNAPPYVLENVSTAWQHIWGTLVLSGGMFLLHRQVFND